MLLHVLANSLKLLLDVLQVLLGQLSPLDGPLQLSLLHAQLPAQLVQLLLVVGGHLDGSPQVFVQLLNGDLVVENTCLNNEVTIEELDKNLRATVKMASDNEQKLDELSRKLGVQEAELKRAVERAELAEKNLKDIEEELETVGDNMKQLEKSAEKALEREEKLVEKIYNLQSKYKTTEARFEYGEMNITKLNQRIDDIEDEIYREKLKVKKCSDELGDTFDDMIANY